MNKKSNWRYVKPLYNLCNALAIAPPHAFGEEPTAPSLWYKSFAMGQILLISGSYVHSHLGRDKYLYSTMDPTVAVTDKIANFCLSMFNIILRLIMIFRHGTNIKVFMNQAYEISKHNEFSCFTPKNFKIHLWAFNLYMAFLLAFDAWVWLSSVGFEIFQFYAGRSFLYYMCNLPIYFMFHCAWLIKRMFESLNAHLTTTIKYFVFQNEGKIEYLISEFKTVTSPPTINQYEDLKNLRKIYNKICDLVDSFNSLYGFIILAAILVIITYILNMIDLFLVYAVQADTDIKGAQYGPELIILCGCWIITLLTLIILLAYACTGAVSESEKVSTICFVRLNEISITAKHEKDQILKEELQLLVQQSTIRRPKFSAAGFFVVDFTLLGFIMGSVTSYVIVTIQFIK